MVELGALSPLGREHQTVSPDAVVADLGRGQSLLERLVDAVEVHVVAGEL